MNKLTLLFGLLLCIVAVNARHFRDQDDGDALENEEETLRRSKEHNSQPRHRKKRWQMNYGYDYPPPSYMYPERRDYDRNNQELQHITRLLEEISAYIKRPPPPPTPPQPIYIPYPMYFNFPQIPSGPCNNQNGTGTNGKLPVPDSRINIKEMDPNQNWGLVVSSENEYDDGSDGSRPISFDPIVPKQLMKRPTPKVDHGSVQASAQHPTTQAPKFQDDSPLARTPLPGLCNAAILSCCGMSKDKAQQEQCFSNIGCSASFADGDACNPQSIQRALQSFQAAYAPVQ